MKNRNKNIYGLLIIVCTMIFSYTFSSWTPVDQFVAQSISTNCSSGKNYSYYVGQMPTYGILLSSGLDNTWKLNNHPTQGGIPISRDTYPQYISAVYVWNPYGVLSSGLQQTIPNQTIPNFFFLSNIKPNNVTTVKFARQFSGTYITTGGTNRSALAAQINPQISWQKVINRTSNPSYTGYFWIDQNDAQHFWNNTFTNAQLSTPIPKFSFCMNIYVAKCGDGVIDDPNKTGGNNTNGKQGIQTAQGFITWSNTGFNPEVCDSNTETGAACVNGTAGCCNATCNGFGGGFCGDGIVQEELDEYCDLGLWDEETQQGNNNSYQLSECATFCEFNLEPETLPEELG